MANKSYEIDMLEVHRKREEGQSFTEIAEDIGCHRTTVSRRYNKWKEDVEPYGVIHTEPPKEDSWLDKVKDFLYKLIPTGDNLWH